MRRRNRSNSIWEKRRRLPVFPYFPFFLPFFLNSFHSRCRATGKPPFRTQVERPGNFFPATGSKVRSTHVGLPPDRARKQCCQLRETNLNRQWKKKRQFKLTEWTVKTASVTEVNLTTTRQSRSFFSFLSPIVAHLGNPNWFP